MDMANTALLTSFGVTVAAFTGLWLINVAIEDAGVVDYYWGPGFAVIAGVHAALGGINSWQAGVFAAAITLWAARLAIHLVARHRKSEAEDARYKAMRDAGGPDFWWKSLFSIFILQAVLLWLIAAPVHTGMLAAGPVSEGLFAVGMVIFAAGFAIEWIADSQLAKFRAVAGNKGRFIQSGLWALSRHPNYAGEITLWWGLALCAYALSGSFISLAGPALLTLVIAAVSAPLTEQHMMRSREGYDAWRDVSGFIFPRITRPSSRSSDQAAE